MKSALMLSLLVLASTVGQAHACGEDSDLLSKDLDNATSPPIASSNTDIKAGTIETTPPVEVKKP